MSTGIHEVDGYGVVLSQVQNFYPVEEDKQGIYCWGFKYLSGIFEFFYYTSKVEAEVAREKFIEALDKHLISKPGG